MGKQVEYLIRNYETCQSCDRVIPSQVRPVPQQITPMPDQPSQKLAIDVVGPIQSLIQSAGFAITLVDYHSKWAEVAMTPKVETADIIRFLSCMFAREGYCQEIITDNGKQFVSREVEGYLSQRGIKHHVASLYWPRGNSAVERFNRIFKSLLQGCGKSQANMMMMIFGASPLHRRRIDR